jgi:hypothetical protein
LALGFEVIDGALELDGGIDVRGGDVVRRRGIGAGRGLDDASRQRFVVNFSPVVG